MYQSRKSFIYKASWLVLLAFSIYSELSAQQVSPLKGVNSPYDEQHPLFSPTGELFFTVGFHPQNSGGPTDFGDIWMSSSDPQGNWQSPKRIPGLSTPGNDVVVGFLDALTILVYHSGNGNVKQGIHQYSRFGSNWNYLRPLEISNFKNNSSYFSGRLSKDGDVIVMSMSSYGSYGNEDIYVSLRKDDGTWTAPMNVGSSVNSFAQEQTPYLSDDNMTLYFSSNIQGNRRGKDIYFAKRSGSGWEDWATPEMVQRINTQGSETSYVSYGPNPTMAIFSSTQNSEGFGDFMVSEFLKVEPLNAIVLASDEAEEIPVQMVEAPSEVALLTPQENLVAVSNETKLPEPEPQTLEPIKESQPEAVTPMTASTESESQPREWVDVRVLDGTTQEEITYQLEIANDRGTKRPLQGQSEWSAASEDLQWTNVFVLAKGYIPQLLARDDWEALQGKNLLMSPAKAGASIVLENIQFNRGTSDFADAKSIQVLDNLVSFMKDNPNIKIRLEGHTDNAGDPSLNKDLSMKRASKIRGYLTINGIDFERVRISGWGGTRPIADNSSEEGRERNRRVEMLIENL